MSSLSEESMVTHAREVLKRYKVQSGIEVQTRRKWKAQDTVKQAESQLW